MAAASAVDYDEPGPLDLRTYDWSDVGQRPIEADESVYIPLEEPAAELDNDWNYSVREDLKRINEYLGELGNRITYVENDLVDLREDHETLEDAFWAHNHDNRYYRKPLADDKFVDEIGDTMTGDLVMDDLSRTAYRREDGTEWWVGLNQTNNGAVEESYAITYGDGTEAYPDFEIRAPDVSDYTTAEAYVAGQRIATRSWSSSEFLDEKGDRLRGALDVDTQRLEFKRSDGQKWRMERNGNNLAMYVPETGGREFEVYSDGSNWGNSKAFIGGDQVATRSWATDTLVDEAGDTMTGHLGFESGQGINLPRSDNVNWRVRAYNHYSKDARDFTVSLNSTGQDEFILRNDPANDRSDTEAYVGGDQVATRPWATDTLVDEAGDSMTGRLWMRYNDSTIRVGDVGSNTSGPHTIEFGNDQNANRLMSIMYRTSPQSLNIEDGLENQLVRIEHDGRTYFEGGSVYFTNSDSEANDTYDAVWEMEPSGKDFRIHLKRDPVDILDDGRTGDFVNFFDSSGRESFMRFHHGTQHTEVHEVRNIHGGGTPLARDPAYEDSEPGDVWYNPNQDAYYGRLKNGQTTKLG